MYAMTATHPLPDHFRSDIETMSAVFRRFGEVECRIIDSPLYRRFSLGIADDEEMLRLAAARREGQPPPNILYAAVQYLLLTGVEDPLRDYYPALTDNPLPPDHAYPAFRAFCFDHEAELRDIMAARTVQTNVVRRSAMLLPAYALISQLAGGAPLAQVEVGASAGLNLNWPRYRYDYGNATWGDRASPVLLSAEARGDLPLPALPATLSSVWAAGVDLHPIDLSDDDAVLWLHALVWPENVLLHQQLTAAIAIAREQPPRVVQGNASDLLPELLDEAPPDTTLCVYGTHTFYQFPRDDLLRLLKSMQTYSRKRSVYFVSMESSGDEHSDLRLTVYEGGERRIIDLARCHPHGYWLEWLYEG